MTTTRINPLVSDIAPSPTNPRKHFNEATLKELAASIKEHGVVSPILVRTNPNTGADQPFYELIFGERRWRASQMAGRTNIQADLRDDLSDAEIVEIQLIENLQGEDLHPLEEAEGYGRMMREHGYTADQLAHKIGKSRSYIFGRLKLLDLDEDGRRLFYAGALNASTALLVSRIPSHKLQARAIEDLTRTDFYGDTQSVRQAQRHIRDRYMLKLDDAPFPSEDGELIATAGPCSACPKRTGNSPDLFDDIDSANVCTDPDCFTAKKIAAAERRAKAAGPNVKVATGEEADKMLSYGGGETRTHAPLDSTCYDDPKHRTYREILDGDDKAVTLVENKLKGELVPVVAKKVITEKLKAAGVVTEAQKNRDENKKIKAQVTLANAFRERLFRILREQARDATHTNDPHDYDFGSLMVDALPIIARRFLIDAGQTRAENIAALYGAIGANSFDRTEAFRNGLSNYDTEEMLLICLDLTLLAELKTDEFNLKREPEGMLALAKAMKIDTAALLDHVKESLKPAPKAAKKGKKSSPATSEDHSHPSEAAQAAGTDRAEGEGAATEAAQAGGEESLEGQNPAPAAAEADLSSAAGAAVEKPVPTAKLGALPNKHGVYQCEPDEVFKWSAGRNAAVVKILELQNGIWLLAVNTATATSSASGPLCVRHGSPMSRDEALRSARAQLLRPHGFSSELKGKQKDALIHFANTLTGTQETPVESDAKPSETSDHSFGIDDTVRVKPDLELDGFRHGAAGKGGVIQTIYIDGRSKPIVVMIDGDELCFDPQDLILIGSGARPSSAAGRPPIQYRHPDHAELEWTGRGRKPKWVEHCLAGGMTLDNLKVRGAAA